MNFRSTALIGALVSLFTPVGLAGGFAPITYQGRLEEGLLPADGTYDMRFQLYEDNGADEVGQPVLVNGVIVDNGLFTVEIEFGDHFEGDPRWVEVSVRPAGIGSYTTLSPLQPLNATPYALYAFSAPTGSGRWSASGANIYNNNSGNVGVGFNSPDTRLEVRSHMRVTHDGGPGPIVALGSGILDLKSNSTGTDRPYGAVNFLDGDNGVRGRIQYGAATGLLSPRGMRFATEGSTRLFIKDTGEVGIGAFSPGAPLHVQEGLAGVAPHTSSSAVFERNGNNYLSILSTDNTERGLLFGDPESFVNGGIMYNSASHRDGLGFRTGGNVTRMVVASDGDVGINRTNPTARLHVVSSDEQLAQFTQFGNEPGFVITSISSTSNFPALSVNGFSNNVPALQITGTASADVIEIRGADLAEKFPVSGDRDAATPGTVMEIDPENPGKLRVAHGAYSRRVAGVVSGANDLPAGTILGNLPGSEDSPPIALSGRVWVRCDATTGSIEPGDLLTTSDLAGHAMKVRDGARSQGAVLGKAMTPLKSGNGLVLTLITLQ